MSEHTYTNEHETDKIATDDAWSISIHELGETCEKDTDREGAKAMTEYMVLKQLQHRAKCEYEAATKHWNERIKKLTPLVVSYLEKRGRKKVVVRNIEPITFTKPRAPSVLSFGADKSGRCSVASYNDDAASTTGNTTGKQSATTPRRVLPAFLQRGPPSRNSRGSKHNGNSSSPRLDICRSMMSPNPCVTPTPVSVPVPVSVPIPVSSVSSEQQTLRATSAFTFDPPPIRTQESEEEQDLCHRDMMPPPPPPPPPAQFVPIPTPTGSQHVLHTASNTNDDDESGEGDTSRSETPNTVVRQATGRASPTGSVRSVGGTLTALGHNVSEMVQHGDSLMLIPVIRREAMTEEFVLTRMEAFMVHELNMSDTNVTSAINTFKRYITRQSKHYGTRLTHTIKIANRKRTREEAEANVSLMTMEACTNSSDMQALQAMNAAVIHTVSDGIVRNGIEHMKRMRFSTPTTSDK